MDPGAVLFVNENLGGHASMHLSLRDALPRVCPGLDARFIDVPPAGYLRRAVSAQLPVLAPLDLDLHPLRFQLAESEVARRLVRRACLESRPDVIHCYTQSIALRSVDILRAYPSVVSTDATFLQGAYHLPHRRPTRYTVVGGPGGPPVRGEGVRRGDPCRRPVRMGGRLPRAGLRRRPGPHPRRPVRDRARPAAGPPPSARPARGHVRGVDPRAEGRCSACSGSSGITCATAACSTSSPASRCRPSPGSGSSPDFEPGDPRLPELLANTSVFAFPTEMDNSPYCVLEAMRGGPPGRGHPGGGAARDGPRRYDGPARDPRRRRPRRGHRDAARRPGPGRGHGPGGPGPVRGRLRREPDDRAAARRPRARPGRPSRRRSRRDPGGASPCKPTGRRW